MPPSDPEKSEKNDFVQMAIDDLATQTEGAKMLEVVGLLKVSGLLPVALSYDSSSVSGYHTGTNQARAFVWLLGWRPSVP